MYAVIDIETTGRDNWRNEILQLACIIADKEFNEVARYNEYMRPNNWGTWDVQAEAVHGISIRKARHFKSQDKCISDFYSFIHEHGGRDIPFVFVNHALPLKGIASCFDYKFIFSWCWIHDYRDIFYKTFPERLAYSTIDKKHKEARARWGIENQKLSAWMRKLGIKNTDHHDAIFDASVTLEVLKYQLEG